MPDLSKVDQKFNVPLLIFLVAVVTRIPFGSKMLYHVDSVQFALAMDHYDIGMHQPHPPGYFLYVMFGKAVNFVTHDANAALVSLSMIFSALTVVAVYYLGKELYGTPCALLSALFAITSPNLWFHGEVALTYGVEAFWSTCIALCCWKLHQGKERYIWITATLLAVAGGFRQNTPVFLFPLYLFCARMVPLRKLMASMAIFGIISLCWFVPMIRMTGGLDAYIAAFRELWLFNTGHNSVFERGWASFFVFFRTLFSFIICSIGGGTIVLMVGGYYMIRKKKLGVLNASQFLFFSLWILPSFLFFLLIFIHPANPGYVLIFIPALFVLLAITLRFISREIYSHVNSDITLPLVSILILLNLLMFLCSDYPVSYPVIRQHDKNLSVMLHNLEAFDPSTTALFVGPYIFNGFRQVMYYLPQHTVYQPDYTIAPTGEVRKTFWGKNNRTFLTAEIVIPNNFHKFASLVNGDYREKTSGSTGITIKEVLPTTYIASGPIALAQIFYPKSIINIEGQSLRNKMSD